MSEPQDVATLIRKVLFPALMAERERLEHIDKWSRWDQDKPFIPNDADREVRGLVDRASSPWLALVVTAVAQLLYVEGYRGDKETDNSSAWQHWQNNGMDRRQIAVNRAALNYGYSYGTVLPGVNQLTQEPMPVMRGVSPRRMAAFYADPEVDEWPAYAMQADPTKINGNAGWKLRVFDEEKVWTFYAGSSGDSLEFVTFDIHDIGVTPVVQFANMIDLEARTPGEVEPYIPTASRINQTVFDRLNVQRFGAWKVRYITGVEPPKTTEDQENQKRELKVSSLLATEDPASKVGTLDETPLDGYIAAAKHDIETLAAVSQTPAHEMLGMVANLSAEALAAAEASLTRKATERQHAFGESYEQWIRLAAWVAGDTAGATDTSSQVRWADMESRSLAAAADALAKLFQMGIPLEVLAEKIPGFTQQDVDLTKSLAASNDKITGLMQQLVDGQAPPAP